MLCLFLPLFCSRFSAIKWNRSPFDTCSLQLLRSFPSDFSVCNDRLVPPDLFHPSRYNTIHQTQLFLPATSSNLFSSSFLSSFCLATQSVNNCFLYPDRQTSFPRFFPFSLIQDFDRVCSIIISYHLTDSLYFCFFSSSCRFELESRITRFSVDLYCLHLFHEICWLPATRLLSLFFLHHQNTRAVRYLDRNLYCEVV